MMGTALDASKGATMIGSAPAPQSMSMQRSEMDGRMNEVASGCFLWLEVSTMLLPRIRNRFSGGCPCGALLLLFRPLHLPLSVLLRRLQANSPGKCLFQRIFRRHHVDVHLPNRICRQRRYGRFQGRALCSVLLRRFRLASRVKNHVRTNGCLRAARCVQTLQPSGSVSEFRMGAQRHGRSLLGRPCLTDSPPNLFACLYVAFWPSARKDQSYKRGVMSRKERS